MAVQEILEHPIWNGSIKKIVEFGCSKFNLFVYLKSNYQINKVILVDIGYDVLNMYQGIVEPTDNDYMMSSERKQPLSVDIYNGSIADIDDRILGMDAVICIELIEHLYADVLDKVPITVFGFIKPKLAVFTTPNVKFNVLFPNFTTKFRHDDHKFEWSRNQFEEWANKIVTTYSEYTVELDGIGRGPIGTKELGCCSQIAIFYRKDMETKHSNPTYSKPYKLLKQVDYPYEPQNMNTLKKQNILRKLRKFVAKSSTNKEFIVNGRLEIPLSSIMPHVSDYCSCFKELEYIISKEYHTKINDSEEWVLESSLSDTSKNEYNSDSNSLLNTSREEY